MSHALRLGLPSQSVAAVASAAPENFVALAMFFSQLIGFLTIVALRCCNGPFEPSVRNALNIKELECWHGHCDGRNMDIASWLRFPLGQLSPEIWDAVLQEHVTLNLSSRKLKESNYEEHY